MSPGFPPPMVTTTISISSARDGRTTIVPSETGSRISDERIPHNILQDKGSPTTWVELSDVKDPKDPRYSP